MIQSSTKRYVVIVHSATTAVYPQIANFSGQEHRGAAPSDGSRDRIHNACIVFDGLASSRNGSLDFVTKDPGQTACRGWSFDRNVYESTITTEV